MIIDVGPHSELNVFEMPDNPEAERQTPMFGRGRLDHLALHAEPTWTAFEEIRRRLIARGAADEFVTDFGKVLSMFFRDPDGLECEVCVHEPRLGARDRSTRRARRARASCPDGHVASLGRFGLSSAGCLDAVRIPRLAFQTRSASGGGCTHGTATQVLRRAGGGRRGRRAPRSAGSPAPASALDEHHPADADAEPVDPDLAVRRARPRRVRDNEDLAYVPSDDSLWMADDNGNAVYEINRTTGALKRTISQSTFSNSHQFGGSALADESSATRTSRRSRTTGTPTCSTSSPAARRRRRPCTGSCATASHNFQIDSWQPLPTEWTGAGWRLADGKLYVADASSIRTYDYVSNTFGTAFSVSGLKTIYDVAFDPATGDMLAVSKAEKLVRVNMTTHAFTAGLERPRPHEVRHEGHPWRRGHRRAGLRLRRLRLPLVVGPDEPRDLRLRRHRTRQHGPAPTASFTASPTSGTAPLNVQFTDTSTGAPTSWAWTFGDGGTSTSQNADRTPTRGRHVHRDADRHERGRLHVGVEDDHRSARRRSRRPRRSPRARRAAPRR